jgi:hypothetical protein
MMQSPTMFSQGAPAPQQSPGPVPLADPEPSPNGGQPTPPWLQFLELSVRVVVRIYLGLVIIVLPWTHFWSDNRLLLFVPHLAAIALNGATRGIVSGLGLLNIWIGLHDAIHYNER